MINKIKKYGDLIKKSLFTILMLSIYLVGQSIPIPLHGISFQIGSEFSMQNLLSLTTGGVFSSATLFSLGMGPYMTVSILISIILFANRDRASQFSHEQRGMIQVRGIFVLSFLQSIPLAYNLQTTVTSQAIKMNYFLVFSMTIICLVAGGLLISWIASINSKYGLGGPFIMILPGIITGVTRSISANYTSVIMIASRLVILIIVTIIFVFITTGLYTTEYHVDIQRIGIDRRSKDAYYAFRILIAGTMPLMFATSFMYLPSYIMQLLDWKNDFILSFFQLTSLRGIIVYGIIIYILGIIFSFVNIMPEQIAQDLKESSDYIVGVNPGHDSQRYITRRVFVFAILGSLYLATVVITPLLIGYWTGNEIYTNFSNYFAMLFVLISILDTVRQDIDFLYYKDNYSLFNIKLKGGR